MSISVRERISQSAYGRMRDKKREAYQQIYTIKRHITPYKTLLYLQSK